MAAQLLSVWMTPDRLSVTVENGVHREVAGKSCDQVLGGMALEDRGVLGRFCLAVLARLTPDERATVEREAALLPAKS